MTDKIDRLIGKSQCFLNFNCGLNSPKSFFVRFKKKLMVNWGGLWFNNATGLRHKQPKVEDVRFSEQEVKMD